MEVLSLHRSIRKFKDRQVDERILRMILETAQCASTSNYIQAYTIIRVRDKQVRQQIATLAGPQPWVEQAPVFLVFVADLNRLKSACSMHGKQMAGGYSEQFIVATVDTALVAQNTMTAAESIGLGGVFIGGIRNDPQTVCDLLNIGDNAYPVFGMCLGYPDGIPKKKPRLPLDAVLKEDTYDRGDEESIMQTYDKTTARYYKTRDSNLKDETWSRQMAEFMSQESRPHMKSFLEKKGFIIR